MAKKGMSEVPTFPVLVLIGLTVFGLVWVSNQSFDFQQEEKMEMVYTAQSFGKVGEAEGDFRTKEFGDFTVGETRGEIEAYQKDRIELSKSILSGEKTEIEYNATQPGNGKVSFEVLGKSGPGAFYVKANGRKVFQEQLVSTGTPEITIPQQDLQPGMNTITLGTTSGGIFPSTEYSIEDVQVTVEDRKFHDWEESFQIVDYEIQDFSAGELTFSITKSLKTQPLKVLVNGNEVYSKKQVRMSPEKVEVNPQNAGLHPGYNTIEFKTDGEAYYSIGNAQLTLRYIGNTRQRDLRFEFDMNESALNYAGREDTRDKIVFDYQRHLPSARPMELELNGEKHELVPTNGRNTVDISSENLEERNTVEIRSNTTYEINRLEVMSEKVE